MKYNITLLVFPALTTDIEYDPFLWKLDYLNLLEYLNLLLMECKNTSLLMLNKGNRPWNGNWKWTMFSASKIAW